MSVLTVKFVNRVHRVIDKLLKEKNEVEYQTLVHAIGAARIKVGDWRDVRDVLHYGYVVQGVLMRHPNLDEELYVKVQEWKNNVNAPVRFLGGRTVWVEHIEKLDTLYSVWVRDYGPRGPAKIMRPHGARHTLFITGKEEFINMSAPRF